MATSEFFKWTKNLEVGLVEIDDQHKELVGLLNRLYAAFMAKEHHQIIEDVMRELVEYTEYHFSAEENYFALFGYKHMHEHISYHKEFVRKLKEFEADIKKRNYAVTFKIMTFLGDWLRNHIAVEDQKYVQLLKENGKL